MRASDLGLELRISWLVADLVGKIIIVHLSLPRVELRRHVDLLAMQVQRHWVQRVGD